MSLRFYLDEDVDIFLAKALTHRGVDVITTQDAGNKGNFDREQLLYAKEHNRAMVTYNIRVFMILHKDFLKNNHTHHDIIVSNQLPVGTLLKRIMKLWFALDKDDMKERIEFLSSWR